MIHNIKHDIRLYAENESRRIRGCQQKMQKIENLLNDYQNLNAYGEKLLLYLMDDLYYLEKDKKLSEKALNRWTNIKRNFFENRNMEE